MNAIDGIKEIEAARWTKDDYGWLILKVHSEAGREVIAQLSLRPHYCDRGHIQLLMDGHIEIDAQDSFPRFFFSFAEADHHVRCFLKWKLWKHRIYPHELEPAEPLNPYISRIVETLTKRPPDETI